MNEQSPPDSLTPVPEPAAISRLRRFVEATAVQRFIMGVIIANAIVLGLETSPSAMAVAGGLLRALDVAALTIFVAEIAIKLVVYRAGFFRSPWNVFDFVIVAVSLVPAGEGVSVVRALRIIRAFRLISVVPSMRLVMEALLSAIPGMGSVCALLVLVFYVASVMATKLFGADFDVWFGTVGRSAYSLFQIMTLESWSMGIVRPVMEVHPYAWAFFVPFILIVTFAVLNLFIAIIVNSMHEAASEDDEQAAAHDAALESLAAEVRGLRREIEALGRAAPKSGAADPEKV
ncbi:MAG: ion transporter [Hyphomicrobiales bacterium]